MKKSVLLFLLLPAVVLGQRRPLQGRFYPVKKDIGFVNELFSFQGDSFQLTVRHCQGTNLGQGKYHVIGDSLVLTFEDYLAEKNYVLVKAQPRTADSVTIRLTVNSQAEESLLPGVNMMSKERGTPLLNGFPSQPRGTFTDQQGKAVLTLGSQETNKVIEASFIGYAPVEVPLDLSLGADQEYRITLGFHQYFRKGDIRKYRIQKLNHHRFVILFPNNHKVRLAKVSRKKYERLKT